MRATVKMRAVDLRRTERIHLWDDELIFSGSIEL
jgi:hypothetical protein